MGKEDGGSGTIMMKSLLVYIEEAYCHYYSATAAIAVLLLLLFLPGPSRVHPALFEQRK